MRGAKSYEGETAWSSLNHLILSLSVDPLNHRKGFKGERTHCPFVRIGSKPTPASSTNIGKCQMPKIIEAGTITGRICIPV